MYNTSKASHGPWKRLYNVNTISLQRGAETNTRRGATMPDVIKPIQFYQCAACQIFDQGRPNDCLTLKACL